MDALPIMDGDELLKQYALGERIFRGAYVYDPFFMGQDLRGIDLSNATLIEADLSGADLRGAYLSGIDLESANLDGADLSGAFLYEAKLIEASLNGAKLRGTYLSLAIARGAKFCGADLRGASLSYSNLYSADLQGADLRAAYLYYCNLRKADLRGANLEGVDLSNTLLSVESGKFQEDAVARSNKSASNQGVPFAPRWQTHEWEGMRFRSRAEVEIAKALDQAAVLFLPNCLARLNNPKKHNKRGNLEPDFLVCHKGKWGILEVDGPHHTPDRRVDEQERERLFKLHKILVIERFDATRCYEQPDAVVQEFLRILENLNE